jgi:hypothetical protein
MDKSKTESTVTRAEFEALKKQVDAIQPVTAAEIIKAVDAAKASGLLR